MDNYANNLINSNQNKIRSTSTHKRNDLSDNDVNADIDVAVEHKRVKQSTIEPTKRDKRSQFVAINAYSRHKLLVNQYILNYKGSTYKLNRDESRDKTERQILIDNHQFVWDDNTDDQIDSWGKRIAKKYYDRLFKEYCIADLTLYKQNKVGMRWRTEREVIDGKGQFICGDKSCSERSELKSWEVNFAYVEHQTRKNALVKLRLCPNCEPKLNYKHKRKQAIPHSRHTRSKLEFNEKSEISVNSNDFGHKTDNNKQIENSDETIISKNDSIDDNSSQVWSTSAKLPEEDKPIDDEFDDYLNDLLL